MLRFGGRCAVADAAAGPVSKVDLRALYLKDLTLMGCTFQEEAVIRKLISYIEKGEIRPLMSKTFPLKEIRQTQEEVWNK